METHHIWSMTPFTYEPVMGVFVFTLEDKSQVRITQLTIQNAVTHLKANDPLTVVI